MKNDTFPFYTGLKDNEGMLDETYLKEIQWPYWIRNLNTGSVIIRNIFLNYNKPNERKIDKITESELIKRLDEGHFGIGNMEPKIKSALYFLKYHGSKVVITSIEKIEDAIAGKAGTQILKD